MRFFDRTEEIASLKEILELSKSNAQFTVVTGRRRIGKTSLVWNAYENEPVSYTHLRAHETGRNLVCRLLLEKKKQEKEKKKE